MGPAGSARVRTVQPAPTVSAVVLSYNGRELLEAMLPTLAAQRRPPDEIIVVDNGSTDDTAAYLAREWPQVRVVANPQNLSISAALNRGVGAASCECVALLNNDIELDPEWLSELLAGLERHPQAGSLACLLRNYYRRDLLDGTGDILTRGGAGTKRGHGEPDRGQYAVEEPILAATGGAGLYRASAFADVGGFDESFGAYFEDVDWGLRALGAGQSCWYIPTAVGYHMEGRTTGGVTNPVYHARQWRNTVGVMVKNLPARWMLRNAEPILRHHLGGLLASARSGRLRSHLDGYLQALRAMPGWLADRRRIAAERRLSREEFEAGLAAGRRDAPPAAAGALPPANGRDPERVV